VSLLLAPVLLLTVADDWLRLLIMAAASTGVVVLAALFGPVTEPQRLAEFYRRVQPPGWWRASAAAVGVASGVPLTELRQRLVSVAACAVSTYAWLIGSATALLGTQPLWQSAIVLAAGCVAVPFWWHPWVRPAETP
jgi:hypothetical protein